MNATEKNIFDFWQFKTKFSKLIRTKPSHYLSTSNQQLTKDHPDLISDLKRYYLRIMGFPLQITGCGNCLIDEFMRINQMSLTQIARKMELLHKMKKGKVVHGLQIGLDNVYYCSESPHLTNEVCEKIYQKFGMAYFDSYDENWKQNQEVVNVEKVQKAIDKGSIEEFFVTNPIDEVGETIKDAENMTIETATVKVVAEENRSELAVVDFDGMNYNELRKYASSIGHKLTATKTADIRNELKAL